MNFRLTKIAFAISLISLSTTSLAQDELTPWNIKLGFQYQQFSNNGSKFAETTTGNHYNVSPGYHGGYDFGIGYQLPRLNTEIKFNYMHLTTRDTSSVWANNLFLVGGSTDLGPITWAAATNKLTYDSFDLTAGHMIPITPQFSMGFYGGFNYTRLDRDMRSYGNGFDNDFRVSVGTAFNGFGPTFGAYGECDPFDIYGYPDFHVFGGAKGSFLYGTMSGYVRTFSNGDFHIENIPNDKIVVPAVGANLGIGYDFRLGSHYKLNTSFGYSLTEYFGVTRDSTYGSSTNNASFQGLFLDFNLKF